MVITIAPSVVFANPGHENQPTIMDIAPRWTGVVNVNSELYTSAETVNPYIEVKVNSGTVTKLSFVGELKQKVNGRWTSVKSWDITKKVTSSNVVFDENYRMKAGFEYTYTVTIKAYDGSKLLDTIDVKGPIKKL